MGPQCCPGIATAIACHFMAAASLSAFIGNRNEIWRVGPFTYGCWAADRWGDRVRPHGHQLGHFMFVLGGRYSSSLTDREPDGLPIMIYNPPGTWHGDRFEEPGRFFSIEVGPYACEGGSEFSLPRRPVRIAPGRALTISHRLRRQFAGRRDMPLHAEALTIELIDELVLRPGRERHVPPWLARVVAILHEEPETPSVLALSRIADVHPVHLTRTFRRFHGCTPAEYAVRVRLARAASLLSRTRRPLVEIAIDAGFADQSHFTTRFRAVYGLPPGEFRRRVT